MSEIIPSFQLTRELLQFWRIPKLQFLAQYKEGSNGRGIFHRIRKPNGESCRLPDEKAIQIFAIEGNYQEGFDYEISLFVAPDAKRRELGNNYLLFLDTRNMPPQQVRFSPKAHIEKIANEYSSPIGIARETLRELVGKLVVETNKREETFIYELLQNADDYPDPKTGRVDISFEIYDKYLIVRHNGLPFLPNNVYALCSVGAGEKVNDKNKTGFKGIGFKSVFQNANFVWVLSGGYSFRFDEKYHQSRGEEIFWQVIPIWTEFEEMDPNLKAINISSAPVNFMIRPKAGANPLGKYEASFKKAFQDERVLLFLRSVESLTFKKGDFTFTKSKSSRDWVLSDLPEIEVPEEIQQKVNQQIGPNSDGRVPEKYKDLISTKISFATTLSHGKVDVTPNAKIYAYLPTDQNFGFSFLLNGDFIPDGSREKLFWDLEWNRYLFEEAGYQFILWLKELWVKFKDGSCSLIIPDLYRLISESTDEEKTNYLRLFEKGLTKGITEISFIPDQNGNLRLLSELLVDQTDVSELLGVKLFQQLAEIDFTIMHPVYAKNPIVLGWMKDHELGTVYGNENFLELAHKEEFQNWLSVPENNLAFLKQFRFHDILNSPVVLDANSTLLVRDKIFHSYSEDSDLLNWIGAPCFHPIISDFFKAGDLGELEYTPLSLVENFIIPNKSEIDSKLGDPENCRKFYQYLYKHHQTLPDSLFDKDKLSWFKFLDVFGNVQSSFHTQGEATYFSDPSILNLINQNALPSDRFRLISPEAYGLEIGQSKDFWKKFQVKEVNADNWKPFLEMEIIGKRSDLETYFLSFAEIDGAIAGNACLWIYLFGLKNKIPSSDWSDLCTSFGSLPVFTANCGCKSLTETYLPTAYTGNSALELLSKRFEEIEVDFISEGYLRDPSLTPKQWRSLFQEFHAKSDEEQLLLHHIIPKLSSLSREEIVPTTRLIFENGIKEGLNGLLIKTVSGDYLPATETLLGPPYLETEFWDHTLPSFPIARVVSGDYLTGHNQEKWKDFFVRLGVKTVENQSEYISLKISDAISEASWTEINEESKAASIQFIQEVIDLHEQNLLDENQYSMLKQLPVLSHSIEGDHKFSAVETLWLGSGYKPKFDLESSLREEGSDDFFLDEIYVSDSISRKSCKDFFLKIGVFEDFEVRKEETKKRTEAPSDFIAFVDRIKPAIADNARSYNGSYIHQHSISNWKYLPFIDYLRYPKISLVFWRKFSSDWSFREQILEETNYSCFIGVTKIMNPILWWLQTNPCLPVGDGLTCMPTSNAVSFTFRQFSEDHSAASCINFKNLIFGSQPVEKLLGVKFEPDLATILTAISHVRNFEKLKELDFWNKLKELLSDPDSTLSTESRSALEAFKENGLLPNQNKQLIRVKNLFFLQPGLKLGLGSHPNLLHKDLEEIAPIFGLRELTEENFNPIFHQAREDQEFKSRLIDRLGLVAVAESQENWTSLQQVYYETVSALLFQTVTEIEFSFTDVSPPIQNSEKTFHIQGEKVFYVGNWNGPYSSELFKYLHKILGLKSLSRKTFTDLLLFEVSDIIRLFARNGISVPEILSPSVEVFPSSTIGLVGEKEEEYKKTTRIDQANEQADLFKFGLSETGLKELENLLGKNLGDNERENASLVALFRCIKFCQNNKIRVNTRSESVDEAIELRFLKATLPDGQRMNIMFRSAKGKLLLLNYSAWFDLDKSNTWLFVITGNEEEDFRLFKNQEELADSNDAWVMKVGGEDKLEDLSKLVSGEYSIEGNQFDARVQFLIRLGTQEYQSIFEKLPSIGSEW